MGKQRREKRKIHQRIYNSSDATSEQQKKMFAKNFALRKARRSQANDSSLQFLLFTKRENVQRINISYVSCKSPFYRLPQILSNIQE